MRLGWAGKTLAVAVPLTLAATLAALLARAPQPPLAATATAPPHTPPLTVCQGPGCYAGVSFSTQSESRLAEFSRDVYSPNIVETYQSFGSPLDSHWVTSLTSRRILPFIQLNPRKATLAAIVAGKWDRYLTALGHQLAATGQPVALSFAHEMNGHWYPWGYRHVSPALFVRAWRHVHDVTTRAGASRVIWVWVVSPNRRHPAAISGPIRPWWPGDAYVNWVGLDIYYTSAQSTFHRSFRPTIDTVRSFTSAPILIAETGDAGRRNEASQVQQLFTSAGRYGLLGVIWYDQQGRQDWRLEGKPAPVDSTFRTAATLFLFHASAVVP